jgi:hypothetical protein
MPRCNAGDYIFEDLSNVLNQLMEASGPTLTPANADVVANLPRVKATKVSAISNEGLYYLLLNKKKAGVI